MVQPLTTQNSIAGAVGLLDAFRARNAAPVRNDGHVRQIGGFAVDVGGVSAAAVSVQKVAAGAGVKTFRPEGPASLLSPQSLAAAMSLQQVDGIDPAAFAAARGRSIEGTPYEGIAIAETVEVHHRPVGLESVQGLADLPGDVLGDQDAEIAYQRRQIARVGELARIEADLAQEYGEPVKLAFDPLAEEYLMLRPGQRGYDEVKSAREVLALTVHDASKMGRLNAFRDLLAQYGAA